MRKVRLLLVDDSPSFLRVLSGHLKNDPRIEVVATARDAYEARDLIVNLKPDIITLDLVMPKMNGVEFIKVLMEYWPLPIIVVSGHVNKQDPLASQALEAGAVELFAKPGPRDEQGFVDLRNLIVAVPKVRGRAKIQLARSALLAPKAPLANPNKIIVIGASTGGTEAIKEVLTHLPAGLPGIVMVQHMPAGFTASFAERLDMLSPNLKVREAKNGDEVVPGLALLAPGDFQMSLKRRPLGYTVEVKKGELVNRHQPSVDVIFESAAEVARDHAVGVILTGMGADGARGLLQMKQAGAKTIAQDEASCVVFGMPKEAIALGGVDKVVSLDQVAEMIIKLL